jgi:hypothetical protein
MCVCVVSSVTYKVHKLSFAKLRSRYYHHTLSNFFSILVNATMFNDLPKIYSELELKMHNFEKIKKKLTTHN